MSKTKEDLKALKEEVQTMNEKLKELSEDELKQVSGGYSDWEDEEFYYHFAGYGETLMDIALKYCSTIAIIAAYNGIKNVDVIYEGQLIRIPKNNRH